MKIRCLKPPVVNLTQGIQLGRVGDEAEIEELSHFWAGQVARGSVEAVADADPEPEQKPGRGKAGKK